MHLKSRVISLGLSLVLMNFNAVAQTSSSVTYKNQRGSMLMLEWHRDLADTGTLTGTFNTAVGNCKADIGVPLPILGYFNGNVITVTVNFPHCKQAVAMTGNVSKDLNSIHTLWMDANQAEDAQGKDWSANIFGADVYQKIK